jgi:hypothetical protein
MKKLLFVIAAALTLAAASFAQPRPVDTSTPAANTPDSYDTRYEGGIFGSMGKEKGTLKFDDANQRGVFYKTTGKEMFAVPYASLVVVYPDSKDSTPQTGKVISALPLPGSGMASLLNFNTKYAVLTFDDPDVDARGTATFRFDKKDMLLAFIEKLAGKAKLKKRGDAYYRPRASSVY